MTLQIFDTFEQGTPEWYACRAGIPTASEFKTVLAQGADEDGKKSRNASATRKTYMNKLAGERLTGQPASSFETRHTIRGHAMEPEVRDLYAFMHDAEPKRVAFVRNGDTGCSPDSLIADNGLLEIKTTEPHYLIPLLERDAFPPAHKAQCQGALWVTEREWIDIVVYWPKLPPLVKRAYRDEAYIRDLAEAVDQFNAELAEIVERIRRYGEPPVPLKAQLEQSLLMAG